MNFAERALNEADAHGIIYLFGKWRLYTKQCVKDVYYDHSKWDIAPYWLINRDICIPITSSKQLIEHFPPYINYTREV
jgi:hypothetical protein